LKPAKFAGELNPIGAVGQNLRNENQITLATNQPIIASAIDNRRSLMPSFSTGQNSGPHHPHNPSEKAIKLWKEHGK
jgi:hypothetical protein